MKHIVLNKYGKPFNLGDEVIINNPEHAMHNEIGEICKIRNYDDRPKISVIIESGSIYSCKPQDLILN